MPIRINLLAEAQAAEESRRKDPVKRSIWIGSFVVFLVFLASATLQFKIIAARSEVTSFGARWKTIEKQVQEVNDHRNSTLELEKKLAALDQFTTNRMLWANALDALQHTSMEGVQIVRIRTEQVYTLNDEVKTPPKAASVTEKIFVHVIGKDFKAGELVPKFKESLATFPYFESRLDKTNKVQLTSLSSPQPENGRVSKQFALQMFFQEKERQLYE
jgi:hypothetical protein